ncbi:MAG: hypothetical protein NTY77_04035 [Elusimicrobia bacterium]|nr:hypothetical protein [Elusimicrobiota bacterium]
MRARLSAICLLLGCAAGAAAASTRTGAVDGAPEIVLVRPALGGSGVPALQPDLKFTLSPLTPALAPVPAAPLSVLAPLQVLPPLSAPAPEADAPKPADFKAKVQQLSASVSEAGKRSDNPAADGGRGSADKQFALLTGERQAAAGDDEPTEEDSKAAMRALILRHPTLPPRVAKVIERELGLTVDDPLFAHISKSGSQARNSHTNAPLGEAYAPIDPIHVIAGLFLLRQDHRAYYDSLKNPRTGVVATGVRGGVDSMVDSLLDQGFIPPRSQGRNLRFKNGVYMDLPSYIHEARKFAVVDPYLTEGKDRYPMYVAFRAGDVHNPGSEHEGRIMGDGGTLGQVALDPVTPKDIVSIYVPNARLAQTVARLKGTALAHVQVYPTDILPSH